MQLNKPLKALLLGSVALSLTGAGMAHAFPSDTFQGKPNKAESKQFPDIYTPDSDSNTSKQFPSETYERESKSNVNPDKQSPDEKLAPGGVPLYDNNAEEKGYRSPANSNGHGKLMKNR